MVDIVLYDVDEAIAGDLKDAFVAEAVRLQRIFNLYDPASELNLLNTKQTLDVSRELADVLTVALEYCVKTNGAYDITHGKRFLRRKQGNAVGPITCTYRDVHVQRSQSTTRVTLTHPDCLIDLGSIAKGYIADALLRYLHTLGVESAFIDARGDMAIAGAHLEVIGVQHPANDITVHPFILENQAVATSGGYRQYSGTPRTSHLLGESDARSVTVIAPTLMEADVVATAIYVVGSAGAAGSASPARSG